MAGWSDVPHLTAQQKADMLASYPPHQRKARSEGVPQLGSGAIYPLEESEFTVAPFPLPKHWPRAYALDVGWRRTAALWGAWDRDTGLCYAYSEHYRGEAEPAIHASAIRARGDWIPGVIDPAARGRNQLDGKRLMELYTDLGLTLSNAVNSVESGLFNVWQKLSAGQIKVFSNLENFFTEYRLYRRDEKGAVVKQNDHLMDCLRYLIVSGYAVAQVQQPSTRARPVRSLRDSTGV